MIGLDHRANAVASASESASRRGAGNCRFVRADFRDEDLHAALGSSDAVTAFGVLHRVPDVFSFFGFAAKFAPRIVVEWRAPIFPMMQRFAIAAHSEREFIDGSNLGPRAKGSNIESYGSYGFWDVSTRAAQEIAARAGFVRSAIWGFARIPRRNSFLASFSDDGVGGAHGTRRREEGVGEWVSDEDAFAVSQLQGVHVLSDG